MTDDTVFDVAIIGNYTKDTITSPAGTRMVDGGGFNYGAHAAVLMGLKVATITRLAKEDSHVIDALEKIGVTVFPKFTPHSTHMFLYYPTHDVDERVLSVTKLAGAFEPEQVKNVQARAFLINASTRGEVPLEVLEELGKKDTLIAADVQGFVRIVDSEGILIYDSWPEKEDFLAKIDILKTDSVEAEALTGKKDLKKAAQIIAELGPKEVVLTHKKGVLVFSDNYFYQAPFLPNKLIGRSGRGDTCIASYVARRLSGSSKEATVWAAAVTSLKLETEGPILREFNEVEEIIHAKYGN